MVRHIPPASARPGDDPCGRHRPWSARARAQTERPIRILVGFAAGGGNDVIARLVAQKMGEGASGQVLVDNKTGASGLDRRRHPGQGAARRHDADGGGADDLRRGAAALQVGGVRCTARRRGHLPARRLAAGAGGQSVVRRQVGGRADRDGQGEARRHQLRLGRRGHHAAHGGRALPVHHRRPHDPRRLSRRGAGDRRRRRRPAAAAVRQRLGGDRPGEGGHAPGRSP